MTAPTPKKWADTPFPLLVTPRSKLNGAAESPASKNATEMALVHNVLLRGLNGIYNQHSSPKLTSPDILSLMSFCTCFSITLRSHHHTEETVYFPLLESMVSEANKGVEGRNHEEHESFLDDLAEFDDFVEKVTASKGEEFDRDGFKGILERLGERLGKHLRSEVDVLVALEADKKVDWALLGRAMAAESKKVADRVHEVPFLITNSDITYEGGIHGARFPPFPWFVSQIFRWWYIPQLKGAWQFASCDDCGMPRELPFAV